jgi:osmotically-inducible protein OsmY
LSVFYLIENIPMKSDSQLQQDVMAELKWEPSVHGAQIGVEVKDGVVTLCGHVSSYLEKWHAEQAALRVHGVNAVAVDMDVKLSVLGQRNDEDIARSVDSALEWMTPALRDAVKVLVEGGWITLSGEVDWQYQRVAAADAIRHLVGVTGVSNQIVIKSQITLAVVKKEIEAALTRHARADAKKIDVQVDGSSVTLSGVVDSWTERQSAIHAAWCAAGVWNVKDHLVLSF